MKEYKVSFGIGGYQSVIINAENEDEACDIFEEDYPDENGPHDCYENLRHDFFKKRLFIEMPDGLTYGVPVEIIARSRANHYKSEFDGSVIKSLLEDTIPLFESDDYEIHDWAANNMDWDDVKIHADTFKKKVGADEFQEAWVNGEYKIR